ncbi:FHA domain-containing protein [Paenibacillus qinlingensis]|uniref:DNA-binding winged helix-turn-helix (WHTH) protein n=1 Tax=Paenibacillus qinlingensis TaxID=1837343 RepID=A0ABU1NT12_9BACL|nr:FHA domain-containing protein [Paenibacillus qinlingensis]MDR6550191.1 DNA-binding winged helix-turn-helix (wHTH) protein [Paenibacillus qinlingensis]
MEEDFACLYVIRGEPYRSGTCVNLSAVKTLVGRISNQFTPELAFTNAFISRQHFIILKEQDKAVLYDLGSRHGTEINGVTIKPHTPYPLHNFDIIRLAKGMSVLHFTYMYADETLEIEPLSITRQLEIPELPLTIHWEKRECVVDGKRIPMSEKEYLLIRLLHQKANQLVTLEEIKSNVWPERLPGVGGISDVSFDELNALIYRVRKKYGKDTFLISAVRGSGYVLESELISL